MSPTIRTDTRVGKGSNTGIRGAVEVAKMKVRLGVEGLDAGGNVSMQFTEQFDLVVVGAGHAGCEAAVAAARIGLKTALYTLNVDLIAQMSCNPALGAIAQGHLVGAVDALGGIMGEITDAVGIQFRLLNTSRGPAVCSSRAQSQNQEYPVQIRGGFRPPPLLKTQHTQSA